MEGSRATWCSSSRSFALPFERPCGSLGGGFLGGRMIFLEYGWCERVNGSFVVGSFWKVLWL